MDRSSASNCLLKSSWMLGAITLVHRLQRLRPDRLEVRWQLNRRRSNRKKRAACTERCSRSSPKCDLSNIWFAEQLNEKFYLGDSASQDIIDDLCDAESNALSQLIDAEYALSKAAADAEIGTVAVYCARRTHLLMFLVHMMNSITSLGDLIPLVEVTLGAAVQKMVKVN